MSHASASPARDMTWPWLAVVLAAGVLQAASLAWPWGGQPLWWLQLLSLAVLALGLQQASTSRQAAWRAGVFATAWLAGTFWWLFISMHTYGGLPAPLAALAVLALAAFLGAYYAIAGWAWKRWALRGWQATLLFAAVWTLAEMARGTLWTGFPWGAGGYAHVEGPLSVWPRWLGVYGAGAVASALAMGLVQVWGQARRHAGWRQPKGWAAAGVGGVIWLVAWGSQYHAQQQGLRPAVDVALLQGNIAQDEKFVPGGGVAQALRWYGEQLQLQPADLVVAPETAFPLLPQQLPAGYWDAVSAGFRDPNSPQAALVGVPLGDAQQGYTNSVIGWVPGASAPYRYDKHHLVPFGEFIPPLFGWFVRMMEIPLGDFQRGALRQPAMAWRGERWAPNICYEDLFGEELAAAFVDPAQAPTVLVNVSNIGWFGDSVAVDQHLQISRMRSLELERPMLRATNTGATVVIDHTGTVTAQLPAHTQGVLHAAVQGREGLTPFAWWASQWGLWPLLALVVVVFGAAYRSFKKAQNS